MRIGVDGELSRNLDLEAWAAQIAAMHLSVARMTAGATTSPRQDEQAVPAVGPAEMLRAQVLSSRQGQMSVQDAVGYVQVAGADLQRSQEVLRRMRVVAGQAADEGIDTPQREALQKYVDRSVQDLEGAAEQARYHTLKMLGGTASTWSLPEGASTQAAAVAPAVPSVHPARPPQPVTAADPSPAAGVPPVAVVTPTAVPPTTRPDPSADAGSEARTPGGPATAAGEGTQRAGVDPAHPHAPEGVGRPSRPTGAFAGRTPIGTATQARELVGRLDTAADLLAQVGAAVDAAEQSLLRSIGHLGLDQVHLPGDGTPAGRTPQGPDAGMRQVTLQSAAQSSAAVLVDSTRAQFDAVRTVLGGAAAAAAVGAALAAPMREATMASRPSVEPVTMTTRSARTETSRERSDRGGSGPGVARR